MNVSGISKTKKIVTASISVIVLALVSTVVPYLNYGSINMFQSFGMFSSLTVIISFFFIILKPKRDEVEFP